jgi:enamine deaminase RidA (YjgF/YER057c/UK114 family)
MSASQGGVGEEAPRQAGPVPPQGDYLPATGHNGLVFSAGMTPRVGGRLSVRGVIGVDLTVDQARRAAALAASNALLAVAEAAGGLDRIARCLRLTVYLACAEEFTAHSRVADGASEALRAWLDDRGRTVRSAVGVRCLPSGAPVEVELTAALR